MGTYIFQNVQLISIKMEPKKRQHFLAQFFMPFLLVWSDSLCDYYYLCCRPLNFIKICAQKSIDTIK